MTGGFLTSTFHLIKSLIPILEQDLDNHISYYLSCHISSGWTSEAHYDEAVGDQERLLKRIMTRLQEIRKGY